MKEIVAAYEARYGRVSKRRTVGDYAVSKKRMDKLALSLKVFRW